MQPDAFHLTLDDFVNSDSHLLQARLNDSVLPSVHLLSPTAAASVSSHVDKYVSESTYALSDATVTDIESIPTDIDREIVERWLIQRDTLIQQDVLVDYGRLEDTYLAPWDVFCAYWDDFCYPSSDDVIVYSLTGAWILYFYHEEMFFWGKILGGGQQFTSFL